MWQETRCFTPTPAPPLARLVTPHIALCFCSFGTSVCSAQIDNPACILQRLRNIPGSPVDLRLRECS